MPQRVQWSREAFIVAATNRLKVGAGARGPLTAFLGHRSGKNRNARRSIKPLPCLHAN